LCQQYNCQKDAYVYSNCCDGCGYSFSTNGELREAINDFRSNGSAATEKYGIMNCWDVSRITDMSKVFYSELATEGNSDTINEPIHCWDVSQVTNMYGMFGFATSFNQPINIWDVSGVNNMIGMFGEATTFNQPLDSWDVSNVTDMSLMFYEAANFNQPLNEWNVSGVTDMRSMFSGSTKFNQNLCNWYQNQKFPDALFMLSNSNCTDKSDPNFVTQASFCSECNKTTVGSEIICHSV
jgi:surface protein